MAAVAATIITPYSTLVVELAAVLVVAVALARVMRGYRPAEALATAAVGLLLILLGPALWNAAAGNDAVRARFNTGPGVRAPEKCFTDNHAGGYIPFGRWLQARIPPHDDVALLGPEIVCMQLELLPRRFVPLSANPRWLIATRPLTPADRAGGQVQAFGPGLALVRRR
jgi:hypothetical protein